MLKTETTFHHVAGTNIAVKAAMPSAEGLIKVLDNSIPLEKIYRKKAKTFINAAKELAEVTDNILRNTGIKELCQFEADSIDLFAFMACGLTIEQRDRVMAYMADLDKEVAA